MFAEFHIVLDIRDAFGWTPRYGPRRSRSRHAELALSSEQFFLSFIIYFAQYRRSRASLLAPSLRVLAYLAERRFLPTMALTVAQPAPPPAAEPFTPPPAVITTPCDPWPRPYYLEDGLRRVHPYHFTYNTYCKERWRGRGILDIFTDEFRDRPVEYYVRSPNQRWRLPHWHTTSD